MSWCINTRKHRDTLLLLYEDETFIYSSVYKTFIYIFSLYMLSDIWVTIDGAVAISHPLRFTTALTKTFQFAVSSPVFSW
jgi:hypothetical protein